MPEEQQGTPESLEDINPREVRELDQIPPEEPETVLGEALKQLVELKRSYANWMLFMMGAQLVVVNGIFLGIVWAGYQWEVPPSMVHVWLAGTFVQIVSVVAIIVKGLFGGDDAKMALAAVEAKRNQQQ